MKDRKQKLELTWIGKENRPRLEPRVLVEAPELSYHAPRRVTENDIFDNILIHGDNLLALKALEQEYAGKVKCVKAGRRPGADRRGPVAALRSLLSGSITNLSRTIRDRRG